ncbi:MAG TPA: TonB-dependent receptor [Puia sp.]|nr:TonB-dependent receptor [Puia sp.]
MKNIQLLKMLTIRVFPITGLLIFLSSISGFAQSQKFSGKVMSDSGLAVSGVSVHVKGSSSGTVTGEDGSFTISAAPGATLEFSAIGYTSFEAKVGSNTEFRMVANRNDKSLNEVVVVGYGTVKRKDLTGSVSSIGAATIESVPVPSVEAALQGRAAGVQVTNNDGAPGANISVMIRGVGSLASNGNAPLYVVDGYPITGGIQNINPSDIASMDVLKDASATAIYGIRAANGVVIITTKRGKIGSVQVSLDGYLSFQSKPKEYKLLNAQQFATMSNQVQASDPLQKYQSFAPWHNPDSLTNVDWQNALYRTGLTQNYDIAIRGGNEKVQTAVSIGYYDQKGIVQGSFFQRINLGLNLEYTPLPWLRSSTSAKYSYQNANNPFPTGNLLQLVQNPPTMDGGNLLTNQIKDNQGNYGYYNPIWTYVSKYNNPLYGIQTNQYSNVTNYFLGNSSLELTLTKGLKIKTLGGVNISMYSGSYFQPEDDRQVEQYGAAAGASQNALYSQHLYQSFDWLWENTISYDRIFGKHAIHFVGGVSAQETTNDFMGGSGIPPNSVIRDLSQVTNLKLDTYNSTGGPGNGQTVATLASEFARLSYSFEDKYLITGTIRRDGSSKFDANNLYGVFPSGAVAWKAKQESFLENVDWLSDLKFRGSYGSVGNQGPIGLYQYEEVFSTGYGPNINPPDNLGYPFNKIYQYGYAQIQPANPNLKWETDIQTDIGMDAAFFHGSLTLTADWFNRTSNNFLLTLAASPQTGYNFITRNVGSMDNRGIELALNYNHNINKDLHYNLGLTFTAIRNELTSITSGINYVQNFGGLNLTGNGWADFSQTYIGQPVGEFYGYKSIGIFQTQAQIDALNQNSVKQNPLFPYYQKAGNQPGDRYFADINGDGHVDATDQTSLGSPLPKFYGGFNIDVTYKSWDFNLFFYGVYGNKILNYVQNTLQTFENRGFAGVENVSQEYYANAWSPTNPSNKYSRISYNDDAIGSAVPSSAWIEDGSFLKLKNLTIGYTLPNSMATMAHITKLRIYVSAQNLFTITSYTGLDPEIGLQNGNPTQNGVDNGTYPSSKFFTIGLNLTL